MKTNGAHYFEYILLSGIKNDFILKFSEEKKQLQTTSPAKGKPLTFCVVMIFFKFFFRCKLRKELLSILEKSDRFRFY